MEALHSNRQLAHEINSDEEVQAIRAQWPNLDRLSNLLSIDKDSIALSLENVARLELAFDKTHDDSKEITISSYTVHITHSAATIELTHTGRALLAACALE